MARVPRNTPDRPLIFQLFSQLHLELARPLAELDILNSLSMYRELGSILTISNSVFSESLSLQSLGLLLSQGLCRYHAGIRQSYSRIIIKAIKTSFNKMVILLIKKDKEFVSDMVEFNRKSLAPLFKRVIKEYSCSLPEDSALSNYIVSSTLELLKLIGKLPFALLIEGEFKILQEGENVRGNFPMLKGVFSLSSTNPPYLPNYPHKEYSLILPIGEIFCDLNNEEVIVRPGATDFINEMAESFELICFTDLPSSLALKCLELADLNRKISTGLYQAHTTIVDGVAVKSLKKLGRDLSKTIMIDIDKAHYSTTPMNGILVKQWKGEESDEELSRVARILQSIVATCTDDVRREIEALER